MLENLKRLRTEAGISQKHLAEKIGISQQSINKYENHSVEPDIGTMIRLADFFQVSVDYLVGHTDIRQKAEPTHSYELNNMEAALLSNYRKLTPRQKAALQSLSDVFLEDE